MLAEEVVELVLPPLPPPPLELESRTAVPGTSWIPAAARASDAPIEKRMKARNTRGLNARDSKDIFFRIGMGWHDCVYPIEGRVCVLAQRAHTCLSACLFVKDVGDRKFFRDSAQCDLRPGLCKPPLRYAQS